VKAHADKEPPLVGFESRRVNRSQHPKEPSVVGLRLEAELRKYILVAATVRSPPQCEVDQSNVIRSADPV
jgi:hypothetical protein